VSVCHKSAIAELLVTGATLFERGYQLRPCVCLCLSPVGVLSTQMNDRAGVFGTAASFHLSHTVLKANSCTSKNKGTSVRNFVTRTLQSENFASAYRPSKRVINLARERWTLRCDKLDRRRSTKLTVPPSSDARPLVYHSNCQALSTARFCRAGQSTRADTCYDWRTDVHNYDTIRHEMLF